MDPTLLSLLETIPQKPPRSKLETHRELIRQLRRKGCTYRDMFGFFTSVSASTWPPARFTPSSRFGQTPKAGAVRTATALNAIVR